MSANTPEAVRKEVRVYLIIFAALAAMTVITVAVSYLDVSIPVAISIAMFIAMIKGSLVACFFMHLLSEKAVIYWILILMLVFFAALMLLPILTIQEVAGANYVA